MWGPTALNGVVKRIARFAATEFGTLSKEELAGVSPRLNGLILPFDVEEGDGLLGFEERKGALVKKIVVSFVRECLDVDISHNDFTTTPQF